ncbi:MAG: A/G-specific adenine glycosylase [Phycisphaeraceae bacterium]|nr:A/G-specific adenine glycosylase [Phycisphaeraceae bacterium]
MPPHRARKPDTSASRDRAIARGIERWFQASARDLPWRTTPRDGYYALVSEAMLLQTQASRIAERFPPFIQRFPTIESLAEADEHDVLAQWSGLGYYRRAKNLHAAARAVVREHGGIVPRDASALRRLPGVGRYTAGSIASIVYDEPAPIVDGNVARVLLRLDGADLPPTASATIHRLWARAEDLVRAATSPALLNEGLMELGANICTPRSPGCDACPVRSSCVAHREGKQGDIPRPKPRPSQQVVHAASVVMRDAKGRLLVERRGDGGMWAGLWQAPTIEREGKTPTRASIDALTGGGRARRIAEFEHKTTHRIFRFTVYAAPPPKRRRPDQRWVSAAEIEGLALARPQMRILQGSDPVGTNSPTGGGRSGSRG